MQFWPSGFCNCVQSVFSTYSCTVRGSVGASILASAVPQQKRERRIMRCVPRHRLSMALRRFQYLRAAGGRTRGTSARFLRCTRLPSAWRLLSCCLISRPPAAVPTVRNSYGYLLRRRYFVVAIPMYVSPFLAAHLCCLLYLISLALSITLLPS